MNFEQLQYIVEISNLGSITAAAEKLHVSQPSITQAILNIEKELNTTIFVRSRSGSHATDSGKIIIEKAREMLNQMEELKKFTQNHNSQLTGTLKIATVPSMCLTLLPKALGAFKNNFPNVQVEIIEGGSIQVQDFIHKNEVDLGLVSRRKLTDFSENLIFKPLLPGEVMAVVGKKSPISNKKKVSLKEIIKYPIVILNQEYRMHSHILKLIREFGEPDILFTARNPESVKKMVMEGLAVGFIADISLKADPYVINGDIIPLKVAEESSTSFGILYKNKKYFSHVSEEFIKELNIQANNFKRIYNL